MHSLVTGGGGFLGGFIVEQLLQKGDKVRVLGRRPFPHLEKLGVETIRADLNNKDAVIDACKDIDQVFHVAAQTGIWGRYKNFYTTNVLGTENIILGCKRHNVKRLIYTSSPSVVFDMQDQKDIDESCPFPKKYFCHYSKTKAQAEQMVLAANNCEGLYTVSLRPHLIWGPRDTNLIPRIIDRAKKRKLVQVGAGDNLVDICYVENAAHAHMLAAERLGPDSPAAGSCYFITDANPVNLWDWLNNLIIRLQLPPLEKRISYNTARTMGMLMEGLYLLFNIQQEPLMTRFMASQLAKSHYFSIEKAKKDLDYKPIVSQQQGLDRLVSFHSSISQKV